MLAFVLAAVLTSEQVCPKYKTYTPPPVAVAAEKECGENCERDLAEQFANGDGVTRDYDVAEYFLCRAEEDMAPAEFEGMFEHLQKMRSGEETAELHFCDHVTSGYGQGYCARLEYEKLMPELDARIDALRATVTDKTKFDALRKRGDAFVRAESELVGELSRGGTGYAAIALGAEMGTKESFVKNLERWSHERAPAVSNTDAKRADDELNAAYNTIRKDIEEITFLRDAQRAWIAYRDAFAAYYIALWQKHAPADVLRREIVTQLTRDRIPELRDL